MKLMFPWKDSIPAGRFPMLQALPVPEYYQPVRLPANHRIILALWACLILSASLRKQPASPLFPRNPLITCCEYKPRKYFNVLAIIGHIISAFLRSKRSRLFQFIEDFGANYLIKYGLLSSCLRFAEYVTICHARLGTWLLAKLCHGVHPRTLYSLSFQGAIAPYLSSPHFKGKNSIPYKRTSELFWSAP
jgi:hypothetical protein